MRLQPVGGWCRAPAQSLRGTSQASWNPESEKILKFWFEVFLMIFSF